MSADNPKRTLPSPSPLRCTTSLPNIGGTKLDHRCGPIFELNPQDSWPCHGPARSQLYGIQMRVKRAGRPSHVALNHPIIAAKQSTVIDHISNGRYTLNIVNGWNFPEMEMFGVSLSDHEGRYAFAEEWVAIIKRLWTEDEKFDFDGKF